MSIHEARAENWAAVEARLKAEAAMEALRPSRQFPVIITPRYDERQNRTVYDISHTGVWATGLSPEDACRNFDRVWKDGEA